MDIIGNVLPTLIKTFTFDDIDDLYVYRMNEEKLLHIVHTIKRKHDKELEKDEYSLKHLNSLSPMRNDWKEIMKYDHQGQNWPPFMNTMVAKYEELKDIVVTEDDFSMQLCHHKVFEKVKERFELYFDDYLKEEDEDVIKKFKTRLSDFMYEYYPKRARVDYIIEDGKMFILHTDKLFINFFRYMTTTFENSGTVSMMIQGETELEGHDYFLHLIQLLALIKLEKDDFIMKDRNNIKYFPFLDENDEENQ